MLTQQLKKIADIGANMGIAVIFLMVVIGIYPNEIRESYLIFGEGILLTGIWIIIVTLSFLAIAKVWNTSLFSSEKDIEEEGLREKVIE